MKQDKIPVTILAAGDDPDDRLLIKEALQESGFLADLLDAFKALSKYWPEIVSLPSEESGE